MSRAAYYRCYGAAFLAACVAGCRGERAQSALHPAGPAAAEIALLWWIMLGVFAAVFALVLLLLAAALVRRPAGAKEEPAGHPGFAPPLGRTGFIVTGGVLLPLVVLTPLYLLSLRTSTALRTPQDAFTVRVVGHMWWWEIRYPEQGIVTANEIHIPAGEPVRLELDSVDVIHSFWVPQLHGKRDMIPGTPNVFWIQADQPGVYRGQCAEYCGTQHANMAFYVVALPRDEFDTWLAQQAKPPAPPDTPEARRGKQIFRQAGCGQCHAIQETEAKGNVGPDLTHMGSRRTIGAAMLPNTRGNLAGWIADPQAIKPGIQMPRTYLPPDDLLALVEYLEGLK